MRVEESQMENTTGGDGKEGERNSREQAARVECCYSGVLAETQQERKRGAAAMTLFRPAAVHCTYTSFVIIIVKVS